MPLVPCPHLPFEAFDAILRPLLVPLQGLRLQLRDAELRLEDLWQERNNLVRFHSDQARLLDLKVVEARRRIIELEGGGVIEIGASQ
jgi:hypothetical protein